MKRIFLASKETGDSSGEAYEKQQISAENDAGTADISADIEQKTDTLSEPEKVTKGRKRPGMVKLQKILIASFASVAVVLAVLYYAWFKPMADKIAEEPPKVPPELIAGEAYDDSGYYILMFPHIEMKNIASIEVHNGYDTFTCLRVDTDEEGSGTSFYIKEHPQAPVSTEIFTSFVVDAGYTSVNRRVTEKCDDMSLYGLADEDDPSYYILTDTSGNVYKVFIGDQIPSGGGYYARYDGRDAVYVLPSSIASTLLAPATSLMTPLLGYPISQNAYTQIDEVLLYKNGQPFVFIKYDEKENLDEFTLSAYTMIYPGAYVVNDDNYASVMLYSFIQLTGYKVLEAGSPDAFLIDDEAKMAEYGFYDLQNMPYELYYCYGDIPSTIAFAPSGIDGYYFAYAYLYDMIVLVETETVPYLDWDLLKYVNSALFAEYITDVDEISVTGDLRKDGTVYKIDEKFRIRLVSTSTTTNTLECYAYSTGKTFTGTRPTNNPIQGFYGTALSMKMQGYIKSEGVDVSALEEYASMTVKDLDGEVTVYRFYRYSERCYYTINGEGEFYLALRDVNKLLIDAVRAAYGMYVDSGEEYPELPERFVDQYK